MNIISSFNSCINTNKINSPVMQKTQAFSPVFKSSAPDTIEKSKDCIPKEYATLFEKVKKLEGKDFIKESFSGLLNILNINSVVQKNIYFPMINWLVPKDAKAAANPINSSITVYKGLLKEPDKWEQFSTIAHEALHLKQYCDILRLENIDKDAYIDAVTDLTYPLARKDQKKELRGGVAIGVSEFQKRAKKLGIIKKDSEEGIHAQKLYKALLNYPRLNGSATMQQYLENDLEKEAYAYQDKVYNWAKLYDN